MEWKMSFIYNAWLRLQVLNEFSSFSPHLGHGELFTIADATFLQHHQAAVCTTSSFDTILCKRKVQISETLEQLR